ncbi:hypothetical protein [Streptomyces sp. NPDC048623]|uniref:hypothetical protein n=1 Tax=Streptomyces sp. NPDC048623 TaxID=3155761 RepID=UPI003439680A
MKLSTAAITVIAVVSALVGGVGVGVAQETSQPEPAGQSEILVATVTTPQLPTRPCPEEDTDSNNCFWDAARRGNGEGHSYWVDAEGKVTYLDQKLNVEAERAAWAQERQKAGREDWGTVFGHRLCWAKVGDTSYIECFDGFRETS